MKTCYGLLASLMLGVAYGSIVLNEAVASTPEPPVTLAATTDEMRGALVDGVRLNYPLIISPHTASEKVTFEVYLTPYDPASLQVKKALVLQDAVKIERLEPYKMAIPVDFKQEGVYELEVKLKGMTDGENGFSHDLKRYVFIDPQRQYWVITPKRFVAEQRDARQKKFEAALQENPKSPDIRLLYEATQAVPKELEKTIKLHDVPTQMTVRPEGPAKKLLPYVQQNSDKAWSAQDPLNIRGRLVYLDYDNVVRPLVNVSVNLYDEDTGFDEHLGSVATDWNGNWSFSVNNDDGWWADGRDIYYTFDLKNTRIRVEDCDGIDSTYGWTSAVHDDLREGSVVDFGTETGSTDREAMQVWNILNLAWNGAVTQGQRDPGFVDSCYPEDGGTLWSRFWEEIDVSADDNDAPDSITHEYGHAMMYYAYGEDNPSPGGSHNFNDDAQNPSLAWSEGWATGFMLALRPDGRFNWSEGDMGQSIENFSDAGNRDGNRNEGRVAAALNDMLDLPNDNNGGSQDRGRDDAADNNAETRVSLATMINGALWGGWHTDFKAYWNSLSGELSGATLGNAQEIMYYNYMDVPKPISCAATQVALRDNQDAEPLLEGLRRFRDHGLKDFKAGQDLINRYYRNSPELALILFKDETLRQDALHVMKHFSELGFILTEHQKLSEFSATRRPLIDDKLAQLMQDMIRRIQAQGSEALNNDMAFVSSVVKSLHNVDMLSLQAKLEDLKTKRPPSERNAIDQLRLNMGSQKVLGSDEWLQLNR